MNHPRHHARGLAAALAEQLRHQVDYHGLVGLLPSAASVAKDEPAPSESVAKAQPHTGEVVAEPVARPSRDYREQRDVSGANKPATQAVRSAQTVQPDQVDRARANREAAATEGRTNQASSPPSPSQAPAQPPARTPEAAPKPAPQSTPVAPQPASAPQTAPVAQKQASTPAASDDPSQWPAAKKLEVLRVNHIGDCQRCLLCRSRRNIVFGVGDSEADLMFVGEAPGADEDAQGEPFVGAAGRRLTQWVEALGLSRGDVYIANVLKCRPPGNRDPAPMEVQKCGPFLRAQIRAIRPKVIVALGRYAGVLLTGKDRKLYELRGASHGYQDPRAPGYNPALMVTYHPSYVLRTESPQAARGRSGASGSANDKVLSDLRRALAIVRA